MYPIKLSTNNKTGKVEDFKGIKLKIIQDLKCRIDVKDISKKHK